MSIKKLPPESIETFSLELHPKRRYVSSSLGSTGSVKVFANASSREKDTYLLSAFVDGKNVEDSLEQSLRDAKMTILGGSTNVASAMQKYMDDVRSSPTSAKNTADVEVLRHVPTTNFTVNTGKKLFVKKNLMSYYRSHRPSNNWAFPNYHSVNFFTCSNVPSDAVLLYPNVSDANHPSGCYSPSGSFTFEFHLNPRYTVEKTGEPFRAGTLLHLSSSFALSLVSGSSRDATGKVNGFRLLLQLSSSADVTPSTVTPGTGTGLYAYLTDDNSMMLNKWHHVLVTWGTSASQSGTGSIYIDGLNKCNFVFNSSSVLYSVRKPEVLCVGNYYEGANSGSNSQSRFFAANTATKEGLYQLDSTPSVEYPSGFTFRHQLNAEFHDLSIREEFLTPTKALTRYENSGVAPRRVDDCLFYLPPFFIPGSPYLTSINDVGGIVWSPFDTRDGAYYHPFSSPMSFGYAGRYNALDNFTRDFATNRHGRTLHMSFSVIQGTTTDSRTANEIMYATASVRLRNLLILPCDDGAYRPNFELASSLDRRDDPRFVDDIGAPEPSLISLNDMVSGSIYTHMFTGSYGAGLGVASGPLDVPADLLAVYQRTQDNSSNEVVFFDFSSLFYGERIRPGSFYAIDSDISGSNARVKLSLRDDGNGGIYRSDCETTNATWNHVGNIFYEEGIVLIKASTIPFYGKNGFDIQFEGEKSVHVSKFNVVLDGTSYNTSSNTSWNNSLSASFDVNVEPENQKHVVVSGINFHDENMNVVMRAQLAQPFKKRTGSKTMVKIRYDW